MIDNLSWQQHYIVYLWIMSLFYGIYIVIFAASVYILMSRGRHSALNKRLLLITTILFAISTAQNVIAFLLSFSTTDIPSDFDVGGYYAGPKDSALRGQNINNMLSCISDALSATNNLIADGLLIWRCFIIWEQRYSVICVPIILLIAGTACGYVLVVLDIKLYLLRLHAPLSELSPPPNWNQLLDLYAYISIGFWSTSFITNVLMSLLIGCKIWWTTRGARQYFGRSHGQKNLRVASLIVESGAVYSACLLIVTIMFPFPNMGNGCAVVYLLEAILYQIVGIFPTLIMVLVALGKSSDQTMLQTNGVLNDLTASLNPVEFAHPSEGGISTADVHRVEARMIEISKRDVESGLLKKIDPSQGISIAKGDC